MAQDTPRNPFADPPTFDRPLTKQQKHDMVGGLVIAICLIAFTTFAVSKFGAEKAESPMTNSESGTKVNIIREGTWIDTADDSYFYERHASDTTALREGKVLMIRRSDGHHVAVQVTFRENSVFVRDLDPK